MTIFSELQAAGLPVISAAENGNISMGIMSMDQQAIFQDILLRYFLPSAYAELQISKVDKQQLKDEYLATVTQLQSIEAATNPTNAQVIAAVKFLAKTLRLLLKLLARMI